MKEGDEGGGRRGSVLSRGCYGPPIQDTYHPWRVNTRLAATTTPMPSSLMRRSWKLLLIEEENPTWSDLYESLNG